MRKKVCFVKFLVTPVRQPESIIMSATYSSTQDVSLKTHKLQCVWCGSTKESTLKVVNGVHVCPRCRA